MGLFGEAVVREESQEDGDPNGGLFTLNRHGRLVSKPWLVSWKCPRRSARKSSPEVFGEDDGVVSPIQRGDRFVVDNALESAG